MGVLYAVPPSALSKTVSIHPPGQCREVHLAYHLVCQLCANKVGEVWVWSMCWATGNGCGSALVSDLIEDILPSFFLSTVLLVFVCMLLLTHLAN